MSSVQTDLIATLMRQERAVKQLRWLRPAVWILVGLVPLLVVAVIVGAFLIAGNRRLTNDVSDNARGDLIRACQIVNRANQITRESFSKQADTFAKIIPPTPAGLDALAQLRSAVPQDQDHDCDANGIVDGDDYPA